MKIVLRVPATGPAWLSNPGRQELPRPGPGRVQLACLPLKEDQQWQDECGIKESELSSDVVLTKNGAAPDAADMPAQLAAKCASLQHSKAAEGIMMLCH